MAHHRSPQRNKGTEPTIHSLAKAQAYLIRPETPRVGNAFKRAAADVLPHTAIHTLTTGGLLASGLVNLVKRGPLGIGRTLHGLFAEANIGIAHSLKLIGRTMTYQEMAALQNGIPAKTVEEWAAHPTLLDSAIENHGDNVVRVAKVLCALMDVYSKAEGNTLSAEAAKVWSEFYDARMAPQPSQAEIDAGAVSPMAKYAELMPGAREKILADAKREGDYGMILWQGGGKVADKMMKPTRADGFGHLARQPNPEEVAEGLLTAPGAFAPVLEMLGMK